MKRPSSLAVLILVSLLLVSCSTSTDDPSSTPPPTEIAVPTLFPDAPTVGEILARVETAWPSVMSMRTTFWSTGATAGATPPPTGMVTIEEVQLPADRRLVIRNEGMVTDEQVVVGGRIYMKGALVPAAIAPMVDRETWVEVNPAAVGTGSPVSMQIGYLLSPIVSPFADVSNETTGLLATPGGSVTIDGRSCDVFTFGDPDGISHELALDAANLPCRFVQSAGDRANVTLYEFNDPDLLIVAPSLPGVATPVVD
ncbi:MAG: hypothetical protein M3457_13065 [Chloroflexota bacterium]|nr:hypothetical protein [Chloroflexota bacterium]